MKKMIKKGTVILLGALMLVSVLAGCKNQNEPELASEVIIEGETASSFIEPLEERELFRDDLDFAVLRAFNADTVGWVEVPGTEIDNQVMRGIDNEYYLHTDENREPNTFGAVFIDMDNTDDFLDPVTVAYGHYTPDGSYFTQLHNYKEQEYFDENRDVFVYTPARQMRYEVVSAFTNDNSNILYEKDYKDPETMQAFVDWISAPEAEDAIVNMDGVTAEDRFLVLSTCVQQVGGDNRYLVIARMVEEV